MKNQPIQKLYLIFFIVSAVVCLAQNVFAQSAAQDSLAVRLLLDQNGHLSTTVDSVTTRNADNRIITLDLNNLKIVKVPMEIGVMSQLKRLILTNNLLDSLPKELWTLDQLTVLDLSNNKLGHVDTGIGNLKNLLFLSVRANGLKTVPKEIFTLPLLENLFLSHNSIDTLSDSIANLSFLKYLDVANNQIRTLPLSVCAMTQLDTLELAGNMLTTLPDLVTGLTATNVHLGDNQLCNLSPTVDAWATQKDPTWKSTQACGLIRVYSDASKQVNGMQKLLHTAVSIPEMLGALSAQGPFSFNIVVTNIQGRRLFSNRVTQNNFQTFAGILNQVNQSSQQKLWVQVTL